MTLPRFDEISELIQDALSELKQQKPLVVNITNYVVMNNTANALLAIGASPIMAHSREEMSEMMQIASALVLNIGTLDSMWTPRMRYAIEQANKNRVPVILDPVGCGATRLRTRISREFADLADNLIIRGNASEIIALAGSHGQIKGVDARDSIDKALFDARELAKRFNAQVVVSGDHDLIVCKYGDLYLKNGHPMMAQVTGMGCTHTALTAAFAGIGEVSGIVATAVLGVVGQLAEQKSQGPGSLQVNLLDTLYQVTAEDVLEHLDYEVIA